MGLDIAEIVMDLEDRFGVIVEPDWLRLDTIDDLADVSIAQRAMLATKTMREIDDHLENKIRNALGLGAEVSEEADLRRYRFANIKSRWEALGEVSPGSLPGLQRPRLVKLCGLLITLSACAMVQLRAGLLNVIGWIFEPLVAIVVACILAYATNFWKTMIPTSVSSIAKIKRLYRATLARATPHPVEGGRDSVSSIIADIIANRMARDRAGLSGESRLKDILA